MIRLELSSVLLVAHAFADWVQARNQEFFRAGEVS